MYKNKNTNKTNSLRSLKRGICPIGAICMVLFYFLDVKPQIYPCCDLDLEVTWRRRSLHHSSRYIQFSIRALSELTQVWSPNGPV